MSNLSDNKPTACGGVVLRRTDTHITSRNSVDATASGDNYTAPPIVNTVLNTTPDNDPRWGKECDET